MQPERTCLRFGSHALSLLVLVSAAACVAHAPVRIELADAEPHAIETTAAALQDRSSRAAAAAHSVEIHPDFTLGFVEFDDQGRAWSRAQGALLGRTLEAEARRSEGGGVLVVLFAHGSRHGAAVCDENVTCFRTFLQQIASDLAAVRRLGGGEKVGRQRVVGIYTGWRGLSVDVPRAQIEETEARTVIELMTGGGPQVPTDRGAQVRFGRTLVTCVAPMPAHAPFWMFRASDDIVHGHNGFFTEYLADFLRRVITESITARRGLRGRAEERPAAETVAAAH